MIGKVGDTMANTSGANVRAGKMAVKNNLTSAKEEVSTLTSSWKGDSSTALIPKISNKIDEYIAGIESGMESYACACDEYEKYEKLKEKKKKQEEKIEKYTSLINQAKKHDTPYQYQTIATYQSIVSGAENKLEDIEKDIKESKEKIKEYLSQVSKAVSKFTKKAEEEPKQAKTAATNPFMIKGNVNGVPGIYLAFDEKQIRNVLGFQQSGDSCGVYAMAYGWNIMEGKNRVSGEPASESSVKQAYNDGTSYCQWYNLSNHSPSSTRERYNMIWDEVMVKHKPVIAATQGYAHGNHYVTVVGIKEGATKETLSQDDLIVLNSASGHGDILQMYDKGRNFDGSSYNYQLLTFNGDRKQTK